MKKVAVSGFLLFLAGCSSEFEELPRYCDYHKSLNAIVLEAEKKFPPTDTDVMNDALASPVPRQRAIWVSDQHRDLKETMNITSETLHQWDFENNWSPLLCAEKSLW